MASYGFSTRSIHTGEEPDFREGATGEVVAAIHLSTTYARKNLDILTGGYEYSRTLNPTRKALEEKLASLENAKYGLAFSSGLAAETTLTLSLLSAGDHVLAFDDLYGGTKRLFNKVLAGLNVETMYIDATNPSNIEPAIKHNTKLLWLETPTNPLLKICDIRAVAQITKKHSIILVVDNTFLSPYFQNPLDLGADVVVHSSTKYIGGHSDVLGGSLMLSDDALYEKIKYKQNAIGAVPSPFDCFLTMRGIKTLSLRMERHEQNALQIAKYLQDHPKVKRVVYPGLKSHPQHALAAQQTKGFGGIISFEITGAREEAKNFVQSLKFFALAESLGGVESLIELPASMTHSSLTAEERNKIGISDLLIRMSVGVEDARDLIDDIAQGLEKV
jgi:cystathionine gamma-lyase